MKIETIETARLRLRGFAAGDAPFAVRLWNDPTAGRWLSAPQWRDIPDKNAYVKTVEGLGDSLDCCHLVAVGRESGEKIATCSLTPDELGRSYELGCVVDPRFWRQGYGSEIAQGLVGYARARGAGAVTLSIAQGNAAANALARSLGAQIIAVSHFVKEGADEKIPDYLYELRL